MSADPQSQDFDFQPGEAPPKKTSGITRAELPALARETAEKYGIDPDIFERQIKQESGFNAFARSPKGARGVAQFMPETGKRYGLVSDRDFYDARKSLDAGARHMKDLLDEFGGDYEKVLAAYNAGPERARDGSYKRIPETRNYIQTILNGRRPASSVLMSGDGGAPSGAPVGSSFDQFLRRNNIDDVATPQPAADSAIYTPAKFDPFSGKPTMHAAADIAKPSDGGSAFESFLAKSGISDSPSAASPQPASGAGEVIAGEHPLYTAAVADVAKATGVSFDRAKEFLKSEPGKKAYPGLPLPAPTSTRLAPGAGRTPHLTTEDLMAATPAQQLAAPEASPDLAIVPTASPVRSSQQLQPGVYVPAPYDPFSGKPTVHAAPAPTGPRPDTEPPRHRASLYRQDQLIPSQNIADESALDQRLVELARMRADLLGHPAEEAAPSLALVDEKIRQLSQVKNDLARMHAGGQQSPQAPSIGGRPPDRPEDLAWNQKGLVADAAAALLSVPVTIEKIALGTERAAGITPSEGYEEHIRQADKDLAEIASRGTTGFKGELIRGGAQALAMLPAYLGTGGTVGGMAAMSGLEAAGQPDQPNESEVAKQALIGGATGKVLQSAHSLTVPKRVLIGAATGAGAALAGGGDAREVAKNAVLMGGLSLIGTRIKDADGKTYEVTKDHGETVELKPVAGPSSGDESSPQAATPAPLARSGDDSGSRVSPVNNEPATGMTPGISGTTSLSNEELARTERFFKVGRSSDVTSLGKQPDAPLRPGEAVVAIAPDGSARIVNSSGPVDQRQAIAKAQETLRQQSTLSVGEQVMEKAPPALVEQVESTPLREIADKSGLGPRDAAKGQSDVLADGTREFSPEAVAVKRGILRDESTAPAAQTKFGGFLAKHGLDESGSPIARAGDAGQGARASTPFEISTESRAALDAHRLPADEIKRAASVEPVQNEPEFVRAARLRLRQQLAGNQLNANPLTALRDTAIITGYDVFKATMNRAAWAREMTKRLGIKVKPILDDVWDHITTGKFGAADVRRRLEQTRLVPSSMIEEALSGERPQHVNNIVDFLGEQRKKVRNGAMTASDVARAYIMTVSSQGADVIRVETLRTKLAEMGVKLDIPDEYTTRNKAGQSVIRPEDAMGLWLGSERGQAALEALERGQFDSKAWNEASKVRLAFGDDRLRNRNVFGDQGGNGYSLRDVGKLLPLLNGAKGKPESIGNLVSRLNGVGTGKTPFMKMLLGFGDSPTVDAVEINTWLTGRGSTRNAAGRDVELARAIKDFTGNPSLMEAVSDRINRRFNDLRRNGVVGSDLSREDFGAVVHHWLWDTMKGTENPQRAMYEAMRSEPDFVAKSRARLRESLSGKRLNANPARDLFDAAVITGWDLYQGAKSFGHWSKQMLDEFGDAVKPHLEKIWQQFEGAKAEPGAASRRRVENFPVADIRTDPERFQYKVDHTKTGTSGTFDRSAKFDAEKAKNDPLQVWRDPADGKTYVVDGHNRLGLARRDKVESVPVEFINAKTADEARAVGAIRNILKGNGSDKDTAAFLKDSGITPEQADRLMRDNGLGSASASIARSSETITAPSGASPDLAVSSKAPEPIAAPGDAVGGNKAAPLKLRQKPLEVVSALIKSGLLSGVQTSARNLLSTISHLAAEGGPTRAIASMVDILVAGRKGERSITRPSPVQMTRAAIEAATTGMKEAAAIIKRGTPENELDRLANSKEISTGSHVGDMIVNFPFRFLAAQDKVMKVYAFRESLENRAMAEALSEKRAGRIGADSVDGLARDIVRDAKAGRRDDLVMNAWGDAEVATFNNENKLGKNLQRVKGEAGQLGKFTLDQAALFVSVPWNVLRRQLDGMGLGFGVEATKALARKISGEAFPTLEDQRRFATMAGRLGTGSAVALLGAYLNQQGLMTGYNEEKGGKPKASLLVNGRWYRMDLIPPFGALLALGATLQGEMTRELKKGESRASAVAGATAESLVPQHPFARPLRETVEPMFEAAQKRSFAPLEKTAESLAGRVVPSISAEVARAMDTKERDTHGAADAMKARIPGLREQLPAQRDGLGREVERSGAPGFAGGMVDVFKSVPDKAATDPVTRELQAAGLALPGLMQGKTETDEHFQQRADAMGKMMQDRLTALIESPAYQDLSPGLKKLTLAAVRNDAKRDYHEQAKGGKIATPEAAAWNVEVRVAELSAKESLKDNSAYEDLKPAQRESVKRRIEALFRSAKAARIGDVRDGRDELREITRDLKQSIKEIILDVKEGRDDER